MTTLARAGLYTDDQTGSLISTHSMLKTFSRCPKQADYKYNQRLKPKEIQGALHRGQWIHKLLELYHTGEDWQEEHQRWTYKFASLFDEEKEKLGDLPRDILRIMKGYIWHYKNDEWLVHDAELMIQTRLPDGTIYRCRVDMLIENQYGLWFVDHKSHKKIPDHTFRLLDAQSALYVWAGLREKYDVQGFIWNYLRWKAPAVPKLVKAGDRFYKRSFETDYPTYVRALKQAGLDPADHRETLQMLKAQRYQPGEPQTSPFFRREVFEKSDAMLERVAKSAFRTSQRMHSYDFSDPDDVERLVDRSCTWCTYSELCTAELMGGNGDFLRRKKFKVADPMSYYYDQDKEGR